MVLPQAIPNEIEGKEAEYPAESESFPHNITKVFFRRSDYNELVSRIPMIQSLFGNDPNYAIHPYRRNLRLDNISNRVTRKKVSNKLKAVHGIVSPDNFPNNTPLPAIHLPNLGVDFHGINEAVKVQLRRVPVHIMIAHVITLLQQVDFLTSQADREDYIHGDIRPPNLMIRPETGQLTLIDFDWLRELSMFAQEYPIQSLYHTPPELLLYDKALFASQPIYQKPNERQLQRLHQRSRIEPYHRNINTYCVQSFHTFTYLRFLYRTVDAFRASVQGAIDDSIEYYKELDYPYRDSFRTFDSYGLGQNLMELFCIIYPTSVIVSRENLEQLKEMLASRITKGGEPYSPAELSAAADAIYTMIHGVFAPLCALDLRNRKELSDVIQLASQVLRHLEESVANAPVANAPVANAPVANAPIAPNNEALSREINFLQNRMESASQRGENIENYRNNVNELKRQRGYGKQRTHRKKKGTKRTRKR